MSVWYMVLRRSTGEIYGHDTWRYNPIASTSVNIGLATERGKHHAEVYVDARDETEAKLLASISFQILDDWALLERKES